MRPWRGKRAYWRRRQQARQQVRRELDAATNGFGQRFRRLIPVGKGPYLLVDGYVHRCEPIHWVSRRDLRRRDKRRLRSWRKRWQRQHPLTWIEEVP